MMVCPFCHLETHDGSPHESWMQCAQAALRELERTKNQLAAARAARIIGEVREYRESASFQRPTGT